MNRFLCVIVFAIQIVVLVEATAARANDPPSQEPAFRPPAVPLVTSNPYLSVWSMADRLTDDETRHWTRREHPLSCLIRIDGKTYRLMGKKPEKIPPLPQVSVRVLSDAHDLRVRRGSCARKADVPHPGVARRPARLGPATHLPDVGRELHRGGTACRSRSFSRPAPDWPRTRLAQEVAWSHEAMPPVSALRVGTVSQRVLLRAGDDTSIDWGYLYLAAPTAGCSQAVGASAAIAERFSALGVLRSDPAQLDQESGTANGSEFVLALGIRRVSGHRAAGFAPPDDRVRRSVFDQVPGPEAAAVLAARRRRSGRSVAGGRARLPGSGTAQRRFLTTN